MKANFSVIIPAFENLNLFKTALCSVLEQKNIVVEVIVVDDSRTMDLECFVNELNDSRINYYHNIPSLGAVKNWNKGLTLATGDYILLLHHDECLQDALHLWRMSEMLAMGYDIIVSNVVIDHNGKRINHKFSRPFLKRVFLFFPILLFAANAIGPCACVAFRKDKKIMFDEKLRWLVDIEWYYRLFNRSRIALLSPAYAILSFHGHRGQITQNINIPQMLAKDKQLILCKYRYHFFIRIMLYLQNKIVKAKYNKH